MDKRTRLILFSGIAFLASYLLGAWPILLGFGEGYLKWGRIAAAVSAGFLNVLLGLYAVASVSCTGVFAFFTCLPSLALSVLVIAPLFIVGAIEGLAGWYVGHYARGGK